MTAAELLARLESLGVHLVAEEGRLRLQAARGKITDELKASIAACKPELLALLAGRSGRPLPPVPRVSRNGSLPLSFFQERLWVLHRLEPESTVYNIVTVWPSAGPVEISRVVDAIGVVVRRHEILRASFTDEGGSPAIRLLAPASVPVEVIDLQEKTDEEREREIQAGASAAAHRPFDLAREPPVRFIVYRVGGGRVLTMVATHHIAVDAWSLGLLGKEIAAACDRPGTLPPEPDLQYADYAAWQRSEESGAVPAELEWWKRHLSGMPPVSTFPPDRPRAAHPTGSARPFALGRELSDGIHRLVREEGATVYMALVAACAAVLSWQTGQDDIVLGSPMGLRERPEFETIIGPFVNVLVLRLDLSDDPTFAELLKRARAAVLDAHAHRQVPFEKLVERLKPTRSLHHSPLFQVAVVQHSVPTEGPATAAGGGAVFDLTWFLREVDGQLAGGLEYRSDLYSGAFIDRTIARVEAVLAGAVADRRRRLSEVSLLAADERRQVVVEFNATDRKTDPASFAAQFERQVQATPEACAVAFEDTEVTYRALNESANQVAHQLRSIGIEPGVVVGLCMPRSIKMVAALLAVHKTGGAYLPLDPDFPAERLSFMLADSGARALITNGDVPPGLSVPEGVAVVDLAASRAAVDAQPVEDFERDGGPADLAYLIYTSGSTGRPKGVRVRQAALSNFLAAMRERPGLAAADVLAAVTTLSFDIAALELYLPLTVGARVQLISKEVGANGVALADTLASSGVTFLQATPSTWRLLIEAGWRGRPGLRALCGGEALSRELADALLERTSELWNMYGPTETTVWSTIERVERGGGPVLIGRPIANTQVYVLNRGGHPLPPGVPGELWIGGDGVADGYHGRPELTVERFQPDRFREKPGARIYRTGDLGRWDAQGRLDHLGRMDHQVKVRGFRIELGEIESVLASHPAVQQCVVLAREVAAGDVRLVAYIVHRPGEDLTVSDVRRYLRKQLPDYMVPALVVTLDALPLTPNGKLDRSALPDPFAAMARQGPAHEPPAPGLEQVLAGIWREVLQVDQVGAEDNFFELGGHSLLSLRVAAAVEQRLGLRMDPRLLFFQNLRQIAAAVAPHTAGGLTGAS